MKTEVIMVVGKNPLDDKYGFDAVGTMTHGSFIPDKLEDEYVASMLLDESAGSVVLTVDTNSMGTTAAVTLESGATIDLTGVDGVYTAGTPSTTFTDIVIAHLNGVQNMVIGSMAGFTSAATSDANTIVVTLDNALTENVITGNWTVDIDTGTDNVVTAVTVSGATVTITVTDAITVGQVVTVSHTRTTEVDTITAGAVTNNEA